MQSLIRNEYRYNANFRNLVDEYCRNNDCTLEDALNDDKVKKNFYMYTEV